MDSNHDLKFRKLLSFPLNERGTYQRDRPSSWCWRQRASPPSYRSHNSISKMAGATGSLLSYHEIHFSIDRGGRQCSVWVNRLNGPCALRIVTLPWPTDTMLTSGSLASALATGQRRFVSTQTLVNIFLRDLDLHHDLPVFGDSGRIRTYDISLRRRTF